MKFATFLLLLCFSSINAAAEGMVIVHVRDTKLYRDKNDLIRESKYFSALFSSKFSEIPKDANNDFHVTLERNQESMEVVWDFLIYGKITSINKKVLERVKADAEFLQIEILCRALQELKPQAPRPQWQKKISIYESHYLSAIEDAINNFIAEGKGNRKLLSVSRPVAKSKSYPTWVITLTYKEKIEPVL